MGLISNQYIAGYFDGEGCVTIQLSKKGKCYSIQVSITSIDFEPLNTIHQIFNGTLIYLKKSEKCKNWQNIWRWQVVSGDAYNFLITIQPYCILKKKQVDLAIEFQEYLQATKNNRRNRRGIFIALSQEELIKREWYKKTISLLKQGH